MQKVRWRRRRKYFLFALVIIGFFSWFAITLIGKKQEKKRVIVSFDEAVMQLRYDMEQFSWLSLSFWSGSLADIPFETKKDLPAYTQGMRTMFSAAVDRYNENDLWYLAREMSLSSQIEHMSRKEKIAQLFIVWVQGTELEESEQHWLEDKQPWWVIIMWANVSSSLSWFISAIQQTNKDIPLFVAIDQEWWVVTRIDEILPGARGITLENVCDTYASRDMLLYEVWVNMNFGLVADTTQDPTSFIYPRVFENNVLRLLEEALLCTTYTLQTIKHFPWHGATSQDTHTGIKPLLVDKEERQHVHEKPFSHAVEVWAPVIMLGHLQADFLDAVLPWSLSSLHGEYLRWLWFTWLLVTDDLGMIVDDYPLEEAVNLSFLAGHDLLLLVDNDEQRQVVFDMIDALAELVQHDDVLQKRVNASLYRILTFKNKIIRQWKYVPLSLYQR